MRVFFVKGVSVRYRLCKEGAFCVLVCRAVHVNGSDAIVGDMDWISSVSYRGCLVFGESFLHKDDGMLISEETGFFSMSRLVHFVCRGYFHADVFHAVSLLAVFYSFNSVFDGACLYDSTCRVYERFSKKEERNDG